MNEFMTQAPRDPTPLELFGRLAGAVQTIAEALNTDHPGHPCHGLAGQVEALLRGMQVPRPIGLGSAPAGTLIDHPDRNPAVVEPISRSVTPTPATPVQQTTGDDGA